MRDDDTIERSLVRGARAARPHPVDPPLPTKNKSTEDWVYRWNDWISAEPVLHGVWRRRDGGFRIRARVVTKKTGQVRGVNRALPDCNSAEAAAAELATALSDVREGSGTGPRSLPRFCDWAATVFERKVASRAISSAAGRKKWEIALRVHLIPAFGPTFMDMFTREDAEHWKTADLLAEREVAKDARRERKLAGNSYSPNTINTILGVLRQVSAEASREFGIRDVMTDVANVSLRGHRTYTYEDPNSVKPKDVPEFLAQMQIRHPQHYAFALLGFTLGLRPSSLRPLRRSGPLADVKWDEGKLLVRRSQTHGDEVMESTKTDSDQVIDLDPEQLAVLRWHVERLEQHAKDIERRNPKGAAALRESDLLFPAAATRWNKGGGHRSRSSLDKPFEDVALVLKLGYSVSPRAMRRTFQDLAREAKVKDVVARAICGHTTESMQRKYSTVGDPEVHTALADIIDIATGRVRR